MKKNYWLFSKRERWGLSLWGYVLVLLVISLLVRIFLFNIVPFLGAENRIDSQVLILEGYIEDRAFPAIIEEVNRIKPQLIIATGTSYDQGFYITGIPSAAYLIAHSLFALGIDTALVHIVPVHPDVVVDRTYSSALTSRKYLEENFPEIRRVSLVSTSVHARRSYYLFKKVFQPQYQIGNIVVPSHVFKYNDWFKSSRGFRAILSETIAWVYVRLFFRPNVEADIQKTKIPYNSKGMINNDLEENVNGATL